MNMKATLLLPKRGYHGNLLWNKSELARNEQALLASLNALRAQGYWASAFPEGDGVTFTHKERASALMLADFVSAFPWLSISLGASGDSNTELAELDPDSEVNCTIIVPLERVFFEESFYLGPYRFVCRKEFDMEPHERLGEWEGDYLQFDSTLNYSGLLRVGRSVLNEEAVISKCLSLAEHAMDVIRFGFSSFAKPEFTPNPAGQLKDGMYAVEIIPDGSTHLKALNLGGIARPMSASNNWLGPEIGDEAFRGRQILEQMLRGDGGELAMRLKGALTTCRQAFYTLGDEARFLSLVFALDGLAHPQSSWTGWKHRTYIAALVAHRKQPAFGRALIRFNELYSDVRNSLVHAGRDFFELAQDPRQCCEDLYGYLKSIAVLIEESGISTTQGLHDYAAEWLRGAEVKAWYTEEITRAHQARSPQRKLHLPDW